MSLSTSSSQASPAGRRVRRVWCLFSFELALSHQAACSPYRLYLPCFLTSPFLAWVSSQRHRIRTPSTSPCMCPVLFPPSWEEGSFSLPLPLLLGTPFLGNLVLCVVSASSTFYSPSSTGSFPRHKFVLLLLLFFKRIPPSLPQKLTTSSPSLHIQAFWKKSAHPQWFASLLL